MTKICSPSLVQPLVALDHVQLVGVGPPHVVEPRLLAQMAAATAAAPRALITGPPW